jgi:hypothetical protein
MDQHQKTTMFIYSAWGPYDLDMHKYSSRCKMWTYIDRIERSFQNNGFLNIKDLLTVRWNSSMNNDVNVKPLLYYIQEMKEFAKPRYRPVIYYRGLIRDVK